MEKALVEDTIGAIYHDVHLNDLRYLVLLVSYRIDRNGLFLISVRNSERIWSLNNVYSEFQTCSFRHVLFLNKCSTATDSGRPPWPVVPAAHREPRPRGASASGADDPTRAGER